MQDVRERTFDLAYMNNTHLARPGVLDTIFTETARPRTHHRTYARLLHEDGYSRG